jgi:hypothetical protein
MWKFSLLFILLVCNFSLSQQYTKDPLSAIGIGQEDNTQNATFEALGNNRVSYIDSTNLNFYNSASYSFLSHGQPIFSTGLSNINYQFSQQGLSSSNNVIGLNHFAFGLSFANRFGLSFGLKPFTNTGYEVMTTSWNGTDSITANYFGSGTLSNAFLGASFKILNTENNKFSIGVNMGRIFGSNFHNQSIYLKNEYIASIKRDELKISDYYPEFSAIYNFSFSKSVNLFLTGTYKPKKELNGSMTTALIAAKDYQNVNSYDTLDYVILNGNITYPSSYDVGFKLDLTKYLTHSSVKIPQIIVLASYKLMNWNEYHSDFATNTFSNTSGYTFGLQYAPHVDFYDRSKAISSISRIRYRAGYQYAQLPYELNGKKYINQSFGFGFGIPILSQRTLSSINIGVSFGQKTNLNQADFTQKYVGYSLGVSISPAFYDRWFKKNKID